MRMICKCRYFFWKSRQDKLVISVIDSQLKRQSINKLALIADHIKLDADCITQWPNTMCCKRASPTTAADMHVSTNYAYAYASAYNINSGTHMSFILGMTQKRTKEN